MSHITTPDGTRIYVKDWGSGPAVVLIHGWPLSADMWEAQAPALVDAGFRVIAYDRRGFGRSDQPWSGYDYNTLSDDLKAVLEARKVDSFALVGFSMGGGEVARYMTRHHARGVTKAALLGSIVPFLLQTADNPGGAPRSVFTGLQDGLRADRAAFIEKFLPGFYGLDKRPDAVSPALLAWHRAIALAASPRATVACVDAWLEDFRADAKAFRVPTLILHGTGDAIVPIDLSARAAAKLIPHAKLIEYPDAPHGFCATHAAKITADLIGFLRS
jgi:pimeloyl-ACP methyl ester carboxylesterase